MAKKIILITAFLLVAGLIGYGLYYFFTKTYQLGQSPGQGPTSTLPGGQLPNSGPKTSSTPGTTVGPNGELLPTSGIIQPTNPSYYKPVATTQIVSETATYPSLSIGGDLRYYSANDGKFYRITPTGDIKQLSDEVFFDAKKITWAKNKNQAVIEYPDNSKIIYNFDTKKQVSVPKHWQDFSFSGDGNQIAAKSLGLDPSSRFLITANTDITGAKVIEPMGENADKVTVSWSPSQQVVAFSQTGEPQGGERREVLFIGQNGENFKSAIVDGSGFLPQWSTSGKKLLYSVYSTRSDLKPELWITDAYGDSIGDNRQLLQLNTWADKCTFADDTTLYCAVPNDLPTGAGLSRDVARYNSDSLYKIDLKTNSKTPIALNDEYNINGIFYDAAKNKILFTDLNRTGIFESQL